MLKIVLACALLFAVSLTNAAEYDGFRNIAVYQLRPFARDLGGLLGSGLNQTARPLGFSGFDIGVRTVEQLEPSPMNTVLRDHSAFGLRFVQAEIGMPYRIDGFVRAGSYEGVTVAGGGLRYGLWNVSDEKYHINAMLIVMGSMAAHKYFNAVHFNTSLVCSLNVPGVSPYIGLGVDSTKLEVQMDNSSPPLPGTSVRVSNVRYSAGLRAKLNLFYLAGGVTYTHDSTLLNASAGIRF